MFRRREPNGPTGMFGGNPTPPQVLGTRAIRGGGLAALTPAGGTRQQRSAHATRTYTGTGLSPQKFVRQAGGTNSEAALSARPMLTPPRSRRSNQTRGLSSQIPSGDDA